MTAGQAPVRHGGRPAPRLIDGHHEHARAAELARQTQRVLGATPRQSTQRADHEHLVLAAPRVVQRCLSAARYSPFFLPPFHAESSRSYVLTTSYPRC